jgi:hypothetical protein
MKTTLTALAVVLALAGPAAAQETHLSGTVAEVFGSQIVLATPEGRILVTLPEDVAAPTPGTRITVEGERAGQRLTATVLREEGLARPGSAGDGMANAANLPPALAALNPVETFSRREFGPRGAEDKYYLRLADGRWLKAKVRGGQLAEVKGEAGVPATLASAMLPAAVTAEPRAAEITQIIEIELENKDGWIKFEGNTARGDRIKLEFESSGRLISLDRKSDNRRSLSDAAARDRLSNLRYADVAILHRTGRHVEAIATNPYGERVVVRLNDRGAVDREWVLTR